MMDGTCNPNAVFKYEPMHPHFPDHRPRRCTDLPALALLFATLGGVFGVQVYAHRHGDVRRLIYGFDSLDRRCGIDLPGSEFLFWCKDHGQLTDRVCVPACPLGDEDTVQCVNNRTNQQTVMSTYKTYRFLSYCLPHDRSQARHLLRTSLGKTHLRKWLKAWDTVVDSWPLLVFSMAISVGVGYAYLLLVQHFAASCVRVFVLALFAISFCIGVRYVWLGSMGHQEHRTSTGVRRVDLAVGIVLLGVSLSAILVAVCFTGMDTAIGCIEGASECVFHEWTILWEPFASLCSKVVLFVYVSRGLLLLLSCATMHPSNQHGILWRLELTPLQWLCIGFHLFAGLWLIELSASMSHYVTAWMTQRWYFQPVTGGKKHATKTWGLCLAYSDALRFHVGTLAWGSLLIMVLRPVRMACNVLALLPRACGSCLGPCSAELYALLTTCQETLQRFRNSVYVDVALMQEDFGEAGKRAVDVIYNEVPAVATMHGTQHIILFSGVGTISLVPALVAWMVCRVTAHLKLREASGFSPDHPDYVYPVIIVMCMSVGISFMRVFDGVVDAIFYCFAVNQRRRSRDRERMKQQATAAAKALRDEQHQNSGFLEYVWRRDQERMQRQAAAAAKALRDENYQNSSFLEYAWSTLTDQSEESIESISEIDYAPARLRRLITSQDELYH